MVKKLLNGYTAWIALGVTLLVLYTGTIVWGVRLESKTKINGIGIDYVSEDIRQINEKMDIILEKL